MTGTPALTHLIQATRRIDHLVEAARRAHIQTTGGDWRAGYAEGRLAGLALAADAIRGHL